jgi:uncharacterized protein YbjT (DUF2867 family)
MKIVVIGGTGLIGSRTAAAASTNGSAAHRPRLDPKGTP